MLFTKQLDKVAALCQKHGFVYPVERVIGNCNVTGYNFGPLGALLRRNLLSEWWHSLLVEHGDIYAVEDCHLSPPSVTCHQQTLDRNRSTLYCSGSASTEATHCDVRQSLLEEMLRHYLPTLMLVRRRIPFGLAQEGICVALPIGDSEQTQQHFLWSNVEQHEMCVHYFVPPYLATQSLDIWQRTRLQWWKKFSGAPSKFTTVDVVANDNTETDIVQETHIQYEFPWGQDTVEVLRNYGNRHIARLQDETGISHEGKHSKKLVLPHQIECRAVLERGLLTYLLDACHEKLTAKQTHRTVVQLHPRLAPYKVALVCNGTKATTHVREVADHLVQELRRAGLTVLDLHDTTSPMDTQYTMFDEMGVLWTAVLNDATIKNGLVLLRSRDTTVKVTSQILHLLQT
ncbi:hypothetical protein NP493_40g07041 [Ridgeia piscesae]|uniref:Anticodon-binding domain-containing protein n=1 Tax=Ridgeia piscesae TaxID=27915 RepID=A0AAD9PC89_RIDPI|nr:hypothetical protein NP493_40g07041 [Ridgeia piscesae]